MQKKSDFGGPFFERFVHLYLAFVTIHKIYFEFLCKNFLPSHYCIPHFFENWVKVFSVLFFCTNEWSWFCCYCQGICRRWTAIYFPLYYIAGEKAIFTTVFLTFFKPFTIWRKNRVLGAFFERSVHLYLTFVTMHKTYFEFLCKNSFALSTTLFHTFLRYCRNNLSALFLYTKDSSFLPMMSFMLSTTLFHTFSGNYKCFYKKFCDFRYIKPF